MQQRGAPRVADIFEAKPRDEGHVAGNQRQHTGAQEAEESCREGDKHREGFRGHGMLPAYDGVGRLGDRPHRARRSRVDGVAG